MTKRIGESSMSREDVMKKLREIFCDVFGDENLEIQESTNAGDIEEWDSLAHISILEAVYTEFGIRFTLDEIIELKNVRKIANAIMSRGV